MSICISPMMFHSDIWISQVIPRPLPLYVFQVLIQGPWFSQLSFSPFFQKPPVKHCWSRNGKHLAWFPIMLPISFTLFFSHQKLTLEFSTLSKYTNNQTYADLALKSVVHIANLVSLWSLYLSSRVEVTCRHFLPACTFAWSVIQLTELSSKWHFLWTRVIIRIARTRNWPRYGSIHRWLYCELSFSRV